MVKIRNVFSNSSLYIFGIIFPLLLISLSILFLLLVNYAKDMRHLISTDFNAAHTHWNIIRLNHSLTTAAQMAVITGDKKWLERYHADYTELQQKLSQENKVAIKKHLEDDFLKIATFLEQANVMEEKAINLLEQNHTQAAKDILFSEAYFAVSENLYAAMDAHNTALIDEVNEHLSNGISEIRNAIITFVIALLLLISVLTFAYKNMLKAKKLFRTNKQLEELLYYSRLTEMNIKPQTQTLHPFFTEMQNNRPELNRQVKLGLKNNEFKIYYQPIVNIKTRKIVGCESLIRWQHPVHGLLQPLAFLPLCEATGIITEIGAFVFKTTCQQLKEWQQTRYNKLWISVNFSASQISDPALIDMIDNAIKIYNIPPSCIHIEITENLLLNKSITTTYILNQLRNIGVHLSLDDFGTGHSSLQYLKQFPFSTIKIDRSFIADMETNITSIAIIKATITLGKSLGLSLIAEGVETENQLILLQNMHCNLIQGYLFGKPVPIDEFTKLLNANNLLTLHNDNPTTSHLQQYQYQTMQAQHYKDVVQLITQSFCDSGSMTKYLGMTYQDFLPFAEIVVKKAIQDGLSIVALHNNQVCACTIVEDMASPLDTNIPVDARFKIIFALLDELSNHFLLNQNITKGHVAHLFITAVSKQYQHQGLSTNVNFESMNLAKNKKYDFMYAKFTHAYNEEGTIKKLKNNRLLIKSCVYKDFMFENTHPFEHLEGIACAYIWELKNGAVLGSKSTEDSIEIWDH